ncbi:unnamed protein product [Victoria cruziana]
MAASSSSTLVPLSSSYSSLGLMNYEVFLNFRGEDTRKGFTEDLYRALTGAGIHTFMDDYEMVAGDKIGERLMEAIKESRSCVTVLSSGYADSKWCLMELAAMFEHNKVIVPVFYYVEPSDVRHQRNSFEMAFRNHEERCVNSAEIKKWRQAMRSVGQLKGFVINRASKENEAQVIQKIVERVGGCDNVLPVAEHPVGIDSRVEKIMKLPSIENEGGVKMVGIYGMGGVGKTTLAKEVHNRLLRRFEKAIYLEGIKDRSKKDGLPKLQEEFIFKAFRHGNLNIKSPSEGITEIRRRFGKKKVLVVLDDVDHGDQLKALAGERDWFGEGTRILITTRDMQILDAHSVDEKHEIDVLDGAESLQLFSWHAFKKDEPVDEYMEMSKQVAQAAGGLPLALEVLGSSLIGKNSKRIWQEVVRKLRDASCSYPDIERCLIVSYDELGPEEKDVFLDVACFFMGREKDRVVDILDGCDFVAPESTIDALLHRGLLKVNSGGKLQMHDLLRDMGRRFGSRSRLWIDQHQAWDVLNEHTGSPEIEGIVGQNIPEQHDFTFFPPLVRQEESLDVKVFANMSKLRLLLLEKIDLAGDFSKMPSALRSLQWNCSMKTLPDNFDLRRVGFLDLSYSKIVQLWSDSHVSKKKVFVNLKVLDLNGCEELVELPDFACCPKLEKLNLQGCTKLKSIPNSISTLSELIYLNISGCKLIKVLPDAIGRLRNLIELYLDGTDIHQLPHSVEWLQNLNALSVNGHENLSVSTPSGDLIGDQNFEEQSQLRTLLDVVGNLEKLTKLKLCHTVVEELPDSIGGLRKLENLQVGGALRKLPNSICKLECLRELVLSDLNIEELPESVGSLQNMSTLHLYSCQKLKCLPESIGSLTRLEELILSFCYSLKVLPNAIGNMKKLTYLSLESIAIEEIPYSIQFLENLTSLAILSCEDLRTIPSIFGLKRLNFLCVSAWASFDGIREASYNLVEMSGRSSCGEEYRRIRFLYPRGFDADLWELSITVGGEERVLDLLEINHDLCNGRQWLNLVFPDDFVDVQYKSEDWSPSLGGTLELSHNLSCIREINLFDNDMEELDKSIGNLSNLKQLKLIDCKKLKSLPNSLGCLTRLRVLELEGCESLIALPDSIGCLANLSFLSLSNSGIEEFPDTMRFLHSLRSLHIDGCVNLRGSLPLYDLKALNSLMVGVGNYMEGDLQENIHEEVPDYMFEMSGHCEQVQQTRRIRFIGTFDDEADDEGLIDVWTLSITTKGQEKMVTVWEDVTVAYTKKWQWLGYIFPENFDRKYETASSSDKSTLLDLVEQCQIDFPDPFPPKKGRTNWNHRREGCGSLLTKLMIGSGAQTNPSDGTLRTSILAFAFPSDEPLRRTALERTLGADEPLQLTLPVNQSGDRAEHSPVEVFFTICNSQDENYSKIEHVIEQLKKAMANIPEEESGEPGSGDMLLRNVGQDKYDRMRIVDLGASASQNSDSEPSKADLLEKNERLQNKVRDVEQKNEQLQNKVQDVEQKNEQLQNLVKYMQGKLGAVTSQLSSLQD